jgi:SEC-C motif domain protein
MANKELCPCKSGKEYALCCKRYHDGILPENALKLMRSRYAAYAKKIPDYIIDTTHPSNPNYHQNRQEWVEEILKFSNKTIFENLDILEFIDGDSEAFVTFTAHLAAGKKDVSFTERSHFLKENDKWFYAAGIFKRSEE